MTLTMTNLSEQKIIVCCDSRESLDDAVAHGARIAGIFGKELCLFRPVVSGEKKEKRDAQEKLEKAIRNLRDRGSDLPVSSLTLSGNLIDSIERLAEDYDGIMVILNTENLKEKLITLRQSSIPFLFVNGRMDKYLRYDRIMLPADDSKATKNMALWASYFGRFNRADTSVFAAEEKSAAHGDRISTNLKSIQELHANLKLKIDVRHTGKSSSRLYSEAVNESLNGKFNLLIMSNRPVNGIDDLLSFPEAKMIGQAQNLPVLVVNGNRDMYILCD